MPLSRLIQRAVPFPPLGKNVIRSPSSAEPLANSLSETTVVAAASLLCKTTDSPVR